MTATATTTNPIQRLCMSLPSEPFHQVPHRLVKERGAQPISQELSFPLRRDQAGALEHAHVMRHRRERNRELLGDLTGGQIVVCQKLQYAPPRPEELAVLRRLSMQPF
jgi:hypothetical protein